MGGGLSFNEQQAQSAIQIEETHYHSLKSIFDLNHATFINKIVCNEITEDLQRYEDIKTGTMESISTLIKKYELLARKEGISSISEFKDLLLQLLGEKLITTYFEIPKYDIFKVINQEYTKLGIGNNTNIFQWKHTLEIFQKEFEMNMKTIVYSLEKELKELDNDQIIGINSDLKYHKDHQPKIMTVIISQKFLKNMDIALDVANIIETSPTIQVVILLLYPTDANGNVVNSFGFDAAEYKIVFRLVQGVAKNRQIKAFFFHSIKNYKIVIAPEIYNLIIQKLQSETLVAFHLGGFTFSRVFMKKLLFQIISTKSMLFLSLHSDKMPKILNSVILQTIENNASLTALALTGFNIRENSSIITEFKSKLVRKTNPLDVLYIGEESIITYPLTFTK